MRSLDLVHWSQSQLKTNLHCQLMSGTSFTASCVPLCLLERTNDLRTSFYCNALSKMYSLISCFLMKLIPKFAPMFWTVLPRLQASVVGLKQCGLRFGMIVRVSLGVVELAIPEDEDIECGRQFICLPRWMWLRVYTVGEIAKLSSLQLASILDIYGWSRFAIP